MNTYENSTNSFCECAGVCSQKSANLLQLKSQQAFEMQRLQGESARQQTYFAETSIALQLDTRGSKLSASATAFDSLRSYQGYAETSVIA